MMNATPCRGQFNKPITSVIYNCSCCCFFFRHLNHGHTCELHFESFIKLALGNSAQNPHAKATTVSGESKF